MGFKQAFRPFIIFLLITPSLFGCISAPRKTVPPSTTTPIPTPTSTQPSFSPTAVLAGYEFPDTIDPAKKYLFSLHGRIIEDQGIPAISPDFGEYEYKSILEKLGGYGFVVISEQRSKNTDVEVYARKVAGQIRALLQAGVPEKNITVVGASKGALIAALISHFLENQDINFVLLAICNPEIVEDLKRRQNYLYGNILSIYDSVDQYGGSCRELFLFSEGKGINRYDELILHIGTGHGMLYQPLDEWILPIVQWANME